MDTSNHWVRIWRSWFCKWQPRKFHQSRCSKSPMSLNLDRCASLTSQQKHRMTSCWRAIAWRWNCQPSLESSSTSQICSLVFQFSLPWQFYLLFTRKNMLKFNDIPSTWNCARSNCCVRTIVVEISSWRNSINPVTEIVWREITNIFKFYFIQGCATIEHIPVAIIIQSCCW